MKQSRTLKDDSQTSTLNLHWTNPCRPPYMHIHVYTHAWKQLSLDILGQPTVSLLKASAPNEWEPLVSSLAFRHFQFTFPYTSPLLRSTLSHVNHHQEKCLFPYSYRQTQLRVTSEGCYYALLHIVPCLIYSLGVIGESRKSWLWEAIEVTVEYIKAVAAHLCSHHKILSGVGSSIGPGKRAQGSRCRIHSCDRRVSRSQS